MATVNLTRRIKTRFKTTKEIITKITVKKTSELKNVSLTLTPNEAVMLQTILANHIVERGGSELYYIYDAMVQKGVPHLSAFHVKPSHWVDRSVLIVTENTDKAVKQAVKEWRACLKEEIK